MEKLGGEGAAHGAQRRIHRHEQQTRERRFAREQVQHRQNGGRAAARQQSECLQKIDKQKRQHGREQRTGKALPP